MSNKDGSNTKPTAPPPPPLEKKTPPPPPPSQPPPPTAADQAVSPDTVLMPPPNQNTSNRPAVRQACRKHMWGKCILGTTCRFRHKYNIKELSSVIKFCHNFQNRGCSGCEYIHATTDEVELFHKTGQYPRALLQRHAAAANATIPAGKSPMDKFDMTPPPPPPPPMQPPGMSQAPPRLPQFPHQHMQHPGAGYVHQAPMMPQQPNVYHQGTMIPQPMVGQYPMYPQQSVMMPQAMNQPMLHTMNSSIPPTMNQAIPQNMNQTMVPAINQSMAPAINQTMSPAINQTMQPPAINQPINQAMNPTMPPQQIPAQLCQQQYSQQMLNQMAQPPQSAIPVTPFTAPPNITEYPPINTSLPPPSLPNRFNQSNPSFEDYANKKAFGISNGETSMNIQTGEVPMQRSSKRLWNEMEEAAATRTNTGLPPLALPSVQTSPCDNCSNINQRLASVNRRIETLTQKDADNSYIYSQFHEIHENFKSRIFAVVGPEMAWKINQILIQADNTLNSQDTFLTQYQAIIASQLQQSEPDLSGILKNLIDNEVQTYLNNEGLSPGMATVLGRGQREEPYVRIDSMAQELAELLEGHIPTLQDFTAGLKSPTTSCNSRPDSMSMSSNITPTSSGNIADAQSVKMETNMTNANMSLGCGMSVPPPNNHVMNIPVINSSSNNRNVYMATNDQNVNMHVQNNQMYLRGMSNQGQQQHPAVSVNQSVQQMNTNRQNVNYNNIKNLGMNMTGAVNQNVSNNNSNTSSNVNSSMHVHGNHSVPNNSAMNMQVPTSVGIPNQEMNYNPTNGVTMQTPPSTVSMHSGNYQMVQQGPPMVPYMNSNTMPPPPHNNMQMQQTQNMQMQQAQHMGMPPPNAYQMQGQTYGFQNPAGGNYMMGNYGTGFQPGYHQPYNPGYPQGVAVPNNYQHQNQSQPSAVMRPGPSY